MRTIIKAIFSFTAISFLSLSIFYGTSFGEKIEISEAVGLARLYSGEEKKAKDDALRDAMKKAVEQGMGAMLSSETEVENFQVVSDRIYKKSGGSIESYKILREGEVDDGMHYEVVISAVIDNDKLKDSTESFRLMQEMTGYKSLFVAYNPNVQGTFKLDPKTNKISIIETAVDNMVQGFVDRRFDVIDPEISKGNIEDDESAADVMETEFAETTSDRAAKYGAQYYIIFTVEASHTKGDVSIAQATINAKMYNIGSATVLKRIEGKGKKKFRFKANMDVINGMKDAVKKATLQILKTNSKRKGIVDTLVERLYDYAEDGAPIEVRVLSENKKFKSPFKTMMRKLDGIKRAGNVRGSAKDFTMRVYYAGLETDELLEKMEKAFFKNRKFKGYDIEAAIHGERIVVSIKEE